MRLSQNLLKKLCFLLSRCKLQYIYPKYSDSLILSKVDWIYFVDFLQFLLTKETISVTSCMLSCTSVRKEFAPHSKRKEFAPHSKRKEFALLLEKHKSRLFPFRVDLRVSDLGNKLIPFRVSWEHFFFFFF